MQLSQKGQSTLEYSTVIALVISGILLMGPHMVRAINAHFKFLDDGVEDSFMEEITQGGTTYVPPACSCSPLQPYGCGNSLDATQPCGYNERIHRRTCTPLNCNEYMCLYFTTYCDMIMCDTDMGCCSPWAATVGDESRCGPLAVYPPPAGLISYSGGPSCDYTNVTNPHIAGNRCPDGYQEYYACCGADWDIQFGCYETSVCSFECIGTLETHATWCDPTNYDRNMTQDNIIYYVSNDSECNGAPCQAVCDVGFEVNNPSNPTGCVPANFDCAVVNHINGYLHSPLLNLYDQGVGVSCAGGHLGGHSSWHRDSEEDRIFMYKCCYEEDHPSPQLGVCNAGGQNTPCTPAFWNGVYFPQTACAIRDWVNSWDCGEGVMCYGGKLIAVRSIHTNNHEDRRFAYKCCWDEMSPTGEMFVCDGPSQGSCAPTNWGTGPAGFTCTDGGGLWLNDEDHPLGIDCGEAGWLAGQRSMHDNKTEDRVFAHTCCYWNENPQPFHECVTSSRTRPMPDGFFSYLPCFPLIWFPDGTCTGGAFACSSLGTGYYCSLSTPGFGGPCTYPCTSAGNSNCSAYTNANPDSIMGCISNPTCTWVPDFQPTVTSNRAVLPFL